VKAHIPHAPLQHLLDRMVCTVSTRCSTAQARKDPGLMQVPEQLEKFKDFLLLLLDVAQGNSRLQHDCKRLVNAACLQPDGLNLLWAVLDPAKAALNMRNAADVLPFLCVPGSSESVR
jgi:hypothetical protein